MTITLVPLTGQLSRPAGGSAAGATVTLQPNAAMVDPGTRLVLPERFTVTADETGNLPTGPAAVQLFACDDPGTLPDGLAYSVLIRYPGANNVPLTLFVSHTAETVDIADAVPGSPAPASVPMATAAALAGEKDRAEAAEALRQLLAEKGQPSGYMALDSSSRGVQPPKLHSATHATGGTDPITPSSIGAETPAAAQAKVDAAISALLNGAPGALDTLKELADALGDDANFAASIATALATKYDSAGAGLAEVNPTTIRRAPSTTGYALPADVLDLDPAAHIGELVRTDDGHVLESYGDHWAFVRTGYDEFTLKQGGARGNGGDDTTAFLNAAEAVADGGTILINQGTFLVVPDPSTGLVVPVDATKKFKVQGLGPRENCIVKTADGVGDYIGIFGAPDQTLASQWKGIEFEGFTFDANLEGNPVANEDHLNVFWGTTIWSAATHYAGGEYVLKPGTSTTYQAIAPSFNVSPGTDGTKWVTATAPNPWRARRNPILTCFGYNLRVFNMQFINSPRQSVFFRGKNPTDIRRAQVLYSLFLTTVDATHDLTHDWDCTAAFLSCDDGRVEGCHFQGLGTAYFASRTAIQNTGTRSRTAHNTFDAYYRMAIIGNAGYAGFVEAIEAIDNIGTNVCGGIELHCDTWAGWTSGPAVRGARIDQTTVHTNFPTYQRANGEAATPWGIKLDPSSALAYEDVEVTNFDIWHQPGYTAGGGRGIAFACNLDPDDPVVSVEGVSKNLVIATGILANAGINPIAVKNPVGHEVCKIGPAVTIINPANRAGTTTQQASAVRVEGAMTALSVEVDVYDNRPAGKQTTYVLYLNCTSLDGDSRFKLGTRHAADGTQIPRLFTANATSLIVVDDITPITVDVTASKTMLLTDLNALQRYNSASDGTFTIPPAVTAAVTTYNPAHAYTGSGSEFVFSGGLIYKAIAASTGVTPGTDGTKWTIAVAWPTDATLVGRQVGAGKFSWAVTAGTAGSGGTAMSLVALNGAKSAGAGARTMAQYDGNDAWIVDGQTIT